MEKFLPKSPLKRKKNSFYYEPRLLTVGEVFLLCIFNEIRYNAYAVVNNLPHLGMSWFRQGSAWLWLQSSGDVIAKTNYLATEIYPSLLLN